MRMRQQRYAKISCNETDNLNLIEMRNGTQQIDCLQESGLGLGEDCIGETYINEQNETVCPFEWMKFKTGEELETAGSFFTDDLIYSGDGYVYDFSLRLTPTEFI